MYNLYKNKLEKPHQDINHTKSFGTQLNWLNYLVVSIKIHKNVNCTNKTKQKGKVKIYNQQSTEKSV